MIKKKRKNEEYMKYLVAVDMQIDFITGSLGMPKVVKRQELCREDHFYKRHNNALDTTRAVQIEDE